MVGAGGHRDAKKSTAEESFVDLTLQHYNTTLNCSDAHNLSTHGSHARCASVGAMYGRATAFAGYNPFWKK